MAKQMNKLINLNSPKEIINTLNYAIDIADVDLERARFLVVACKHGLQAHALEFAQERLHHEMRAVSIKNKS